MRSWSAVVIRMTFMLTTEKKYPDIPILVHHCFSRAYYYMSSEIVLFWIGSSTYLVIQSTKHFVYQPIPNRLWTHDLIGSLI